MKTYLQKQDITQTIENKVFLWLKQNRSSHEGNYSPVVRAMVGILKGDERVAGMDQCYSEYLAQA